MTETNLKKKRRIRKKKYLHSTYTDSDDKVKRYLCKQLQCQQNQMQRELITIQAIIMTTKLKETHYPYKHLQ